MQPVPKNPSDTMPTEIDLVVWGPSLGHQIAQWWSSDNAAAEAGEGFYLTWDHSFVDRDKVSHFEIAQTPA